MSLAGNNIAEAPYCKYCGSINITFDATASWDADEQTFVLLDTMDDVICGDCEEEGRPTWAPLAANATEGTSDD